MKQAGLPKCEIIKSGRDFESLMTRGRRWKGKYIRLFYERSEKKKVGFTVPKRLGNAVFRNRIKRLMREVYRMHRNETGNYSIIFMPTGKDSVDFQEMNKEYSLFLRSLEETA